MFPFTAPMEALLACPPSLSSLEPPFLHCVVQPFPLHALAHLDSFPLRLVLWTDGSVSFPFGKTGSGVLHNCSLCDTKATLSFSAGPVCSSFSAEACAILQALWWLGSTNKSATSLLPDSRSVLTTLSSPPSFLLLQSLAETVFSPVLSGHNESSDTRFSLEMTQLMSWPDRERYSYPL